MFFKRKKSAQDPADGRSRLERSLDDVIEIPTSIRHKAGWLVFLVIVGVILLLIAQRQYSPVVHKIDIKGDNWHTASNLTIDAGLYYEDDNWLRNLILGKQYIRVFVPGVDAPGSDEVPKEVVDAFPGNYAGRALTTMTLSGKSFKPDVRINRWVGNEAYNAIPGPSRYLRSNRRHSLTQESYFTDSTSALVDMFVRGRDIFSNTWTTNPYIAFHLTFDDIDFDGLTSGISFYYSKDKTIDDKSRHYSAPLNFITIDPEPDSRDLNSFAYGSVSSLQKIKEKGIYVIMEDLGVKRKSDRQLFFCSVFLGVVVSFIVQLIISLIWDVRDNERRKRLKRGAGK